MKIAETFTSIQGEGHLAGKLMRFVRFAGCNVRSCPMHPINKPAAPCDTDWSFRDTGDPERLAAEALDEVGPNGWVCITGGEPLEQDIAPLIAELKRRGLLVNIQTSGTLWVTCPWDWLTVSPKGPLVQTFGQELKVVYAGQSDDELSALYAGSKFWNYYLMPLWSPGRYAGHPPTHNVEETIEAVRRMNKLGQPWELTTQAHKWWGVR